MSFRLVALMPHHLPRLLGFTAANRVDTEAFASQAAWGPGSQVAEGSRRALLRGGQNFRTGTAQLNAPAQGRISGPMSDEWAGGGMDSTLRATTDTGGPQEGANE